MKPEDIPPSLKKLLDDRAGKDHSRTGSVMSALAEILTLHEQMVRREVASLLVKELCARHSHNCQDAPCEGHWAVRIALGEVREVER